MKYVFGDYTISDDKSLLSIQQIHGLLSQSYWANNRPSEVIEPSVGNSICYGVYCKDEQIGFARIVTDYATMYWLCDVIIDRDHRGNGLGKLLVGSIVNSDELKNLRGILRTKDAHTLYEKFGFIKDGEHFMTRMPK